MPKLVNDQYWDRPNWWLRPLYPPQPVNTAVQPLQGLQQPPNSQGKPQVAKPNKIPPKGL